MTADMKDRNALKRTLQLSIHPFDATWHEPSVSRIYMYTREISPDNVQSNVHKLVEIGNKQKSFKRVFLMGFMQHFPKKFKAMENEKKNVYESLKCTLLS